MTTYEKPDSAVVAKIDALLPTRKDGERTIVDLDVANYDKLLEFLRQETRPGGLSDPAKVRHHAWNSVLERLGMAAHPLHRALIEDFYVNWWDCMTDYQVTNNAAGEHCYRAMAAYCVALNKYAAGDAGSAVRWAAFGRLADVIDGMPTGGGAQYVLRSDDGRVGLLRHAAHVFSNSSTAKRVGTSSSAGTDVIPASTRTSGI